MEPDDVAAEVTISETLSYDNIEECDHARNEAADSCLLLCALRLDFKLLLNHNSTLTTSCSTMQEFITTLDWKIMQNLLTSLNTWPSCASDSLATYGAIEMCFD